MKILRKNIWRSCFWEEELSEKKKKDVGGTSKGLLILCVAAGFFALVVVAAETLGYLPRASDAGYSGGGSWDYDNRNVAYTGVRPL